LSQRSAAASGKSNIDHFIVQ
jgi:serine/threonine protein kinase